MADVTQDIPWRWWRLQSERRLMVDATPREELIALTVTVASGTQSGCGSEARYTASIIPSSAPTVRFSGSLRPVTSDVLTDTALAQSWVPLTGIGETAHPPDACGPGTTLAVWGGIAVVPHQ